MKSNKGNNQTVAQSDLQARYQFAKNRPPRCACTAKRCSSNE